MAGDAPEPRVPDACVMARLAALECVFDEMKRSMVVSMPWAATGTMSNLQGDGSGLFDDSPEDYTDGVSMMALLVILGRVHTVLWVDLLPVC